MHFQGNDIKFYIVVHEQHYVHFNNPPASEASREVANLTEKKSAHLCKLCQRICLSVCLSVFLPKTANFGQKAT